MRKEVKVGDGFGKWTVVDGPFSENRRKMWHCVCECLNESLVNNYDLTSGKSVQCRTCANRLPNSELGRCYAHLPYKVLARARATALNAISRCTNVNHRRYVDWGGRGIKVCFSSKDEFVEYLLSLPGYDDLSLVVDRIDNDKNYEIGNLRWTTRSESQRNQRDEGGEHGYYMRHGFTHSFKRLHDGGVLFKDIGNLYCANPATVRNCVRELETGNAFGS